MKSLKIIKFAFPSRNVTHFHRERDTFLLSMIISEALYKIKLFKYVTFIQEKNQWTYSLNHSMKHYSYIYKKNYMDGKTIDFSRGSLRIQTPESNSQPT